MNVLNMDCVAGMGLFPDAYFDSIVCDPPYELGFMGKGWDSSGTAYRVPMWREALRVLKPGGHLLAFSGSRTYHRMACAIEDAGFDVRDQIMWLYGSGFPKSLDVSKAIDKAAGAVREVLSERPAYGIGGAGCLNGHAEGATAQVTAPATDDAKHWDGWGTALKPAHEPICVARKPLIGTVAANVLQHGTGAINIDACRVPQESSRPSSTGGMARKSSPVFGSFPNTKVTPVQTDLGRWPANFIHDGLSEDWARFFYCAKASRADRDDGLAGFTAVTTSDGPAVAADNAYQRGATERANHHPTVKPTDLMRYLCRLVTPPGGTVLDPFTGSGSTGRAATLEGFGFIGFELDPDYAKIAQARIDAAVRLRHTTDHDEK